MLSRRLRSCTRRFRSTAHSSQSPPEKWIDETIIIKHASSSHKTQHVRQQSRVWDDLSSIVGIDDMRAESVVVPSTFPTPTTTTQELNRTQTISSTGHHDESSASISQLDEDCVKLATPKSDSENPPRMMRLMSPPRVKRMSCTFESNTGRGRERLTSVIEKVSRRMSPPVKGKNSSFSFGCGSTSTSLSTSVNIVPHDFSGDDDKEDTLSLTYTTSSLESSSSLEYSDDDSIIGDAIIDFADPFYK